ALDPDDPDAKPYDPLDTFVTEMKEDVTQVGEYVNLTEDEKKELESELINHREKTSYWNISDEQKENVIGSILGSERLKTFKEKKSHHEDELTKQDTRARLNALEAVLGLDGERAKNFRAALVAHNQISLVEEFADNPDESEDEAVEHQNQKCIDAVSGQL